MKMVFSGLSPGAHGGDDRASASWTNFVRLKVRCANFLPLMSLREGTCEAGDDEGNLGRTAFALAIIRFAHNCTHEN